MKRSSTWKHTRRGYEIDPDIPSGLLSRKFLVGDTELTVEQILEAVIDECATLADNAGHSGSYNDGGAGELWKQVNVWLTGLQGTGVPSTFDKAVEIYAKSVDPEYDNYLRLKEKFGE